MRDFARLPMRFPLGSKYVLEVADHSFGGTSSSPTATEYNFQREKRCHANAGNAQIGIVPAQRPAPIDAPSVSKKLRAGFDLKEVPCLDGT